ncbi:30S ribosome-binding factor RbfA [Lichenibacterium ramalinae]|uniref:Ribosome-binding factor A n=1 Tax=Lichenibacterium ramalinae TaxID=2316527 RepID=A0A4Q2R6R4_9HYPH|nr:30S ribosome-binding factor RbfA [Lichenibacterium ramalinae]RYB02296.1 30S ribosome-binding factor RbfA [Lichenibacterium ramalinae]
MSRAHHSGAQPSQRMLRVGELVRHVVAEMLSRGAMPDPVLEKHVITVPEVRMSPDLKLANVYVMPLGGGDVKAVIEALDKQKKFLRTELAHKVNLKFAPDLKFRVDESFEKSARIDALLASPVVQRDLQGDDESQD